MPKSAVPCGFPECEFGEAMVDGGGEVKTVPVSEDAETVELRPSCYQCEETYLVGVQYGRFRAVRVLRERLAILSDPAMIAWTEELIRLVDSIDDPGLATAKLEDGCEIEDDELLCTECGEPMVVNEDGTTNHTSEDEPTGIDHDADEDHVALAPED